ncbi:unnamed protein product [Adineta steineri]|uniref:Major facilitator superfamily (MFS) profile domain-containing protein n=1 Tax=Adineta steineri TaxID=433720 RepID=A0A813R586_9BILA|nr:unnamed protein product [Adineta steineri]
MVYTWSFAAAIPSFRCALSENDTVFNRNISIQYDRSQPDEDYCKANMKISVKECQRCYMKTISQTGIVQLQPCEGYVFDRKYHQYTLVEEWLMVCDRTIFRSAVQNLFFVGYMVGSIFFGIMADNYLVYTISRFILACSTRGIAVTGFVLATELVGPKNKFLTAICVQYFFASGQLFLVSFAYFIREWRRLTFSLSLFTLPFTLFYFVLPESARWMISKGHYKQAEELFRKIAKTNKRIFNEEAFEQLKNVQEKTRTTDTQKVGVLSLFQSKIMCIISINLFFQWFVQNLVFYGVSQSTGSWGFDPYLSFAISACVEIVSYIVLHLILNRIGRKRPYFVAVFGFAIVALLSIPVQNLMVKNSPSQKVVIFMINVLLKFLAAGSYAIIYIYSNELFPTGVRNTGMGICSMVARIGAIVGTTSNDMLTRLWINFPTVLFGILCFIAAFLILMLPETLNRTLPQTIEDTEQMGLSCIRIRGNQRTSKQQEDTYKKDDQDSIDSYTLSERL